VRLSGVFEDVLPEDVVEDLLAVLREALGNVTHHARAASATVAATAAPGRLTLQVSDDGAGFGPTARRSGLDNLARRAEHHGGTLTVAPNTPTGTELTWTVPLS
jgi:signal transduction histidine kinase